MQKSYPVGVDERQGAAQGAVVISGWLKKKAASNGAWNTRFVALKGNGSLEYNKRSREGTMMRKKQTSDMATRLQLTRSSTVSKRSAGSGAGLQRKASGRGITRKESGKALVRKQSGKEGRNNSSGGGAFHDGSPVIKPSQETSFLISGETHRDLQFAAESPEEADRWYNAITQTLAEITEGKRTNFDSFAFTKKANIFKNAGGERKISAGKIENPGWHMRVGHGDDARDCFVFADTWEFVDLPSGGGRNGSFSEAERQPATLDLLV